MVWRRGQEGSAIEVLRAQNLRLTRALQSNIVVVYTQYLYIYMSDNIYCVFNHNRDLGQKSAPINCRRNVQLAYYSVARIGEGSMSIVNIFYQCHLSLDIV